MRKHGRLHLRSRPSSSGGKGRKHLRIGDRRRCRHRRAASCNAKGSACHTSYSVRRENRLSATYYRAWRNTRPGSALHFSVFARDKCGRTLVPVRPLAAAHWQSRLVRLASYPSILRGEMVHCAETGSRHGRVIGAKFAWSRERREGKRAIGERCVMVLLSPDDAVRDGLASSGLLGERCMRIWGFLPYR